MLYKIDNETLIPAPATYTLPDGRTISNFSASPELMAAHGYTLTEAEAEEWRQAHPAPEPPARTTCTRYELISALRDHFPALLVTLTKAYAADAELQFWWSSVLDLDRENADFQAAAGRLGITTEQLDAIFAAIGEA